MQLPVKLLTGSNSAGFKLNVGFEGITNHASKYAGGRVTCLRVCTRVPCTTRLAPVYAFTRARMQNALVNRHYAQMHTQNFHSIRPNKRASSIMPRVTRSKITYNSTVNFNVSTSPPSTSMSLSSFPTFLTCLSLLPFFRRPRRNIRESSKRRFSFHRDLGNTHLATGTFREAKNDPLRIKL